jgi:hypothetical protein
MQIQVIGKIMCMNYCAFLDCFMCRHLQVLFLVSLPRCNCAATLGTGVELALTKQIGCKVVKCKAIFESTLR